jgi:GDSL-like Lipase/Acylhydrolase family
MIAAKTPSRMIHRRSFLVAGTAALGCCAGFAQGQAPMTHIVLLGDSIFDNAAYVAGGPDVVRQLRDVLPSGWRATLNARDGAVIADLPQQLQNLPTDATHLVVSIGGNDALGESSLLERKVSSMAEALELITVVRERFRSGYARMLDQVLQRRLPLAVCTIYEARFPEPVTRRLAATALTAVNDAITREAFARSIDCIDLRILCDDDRDFANPIEPSVHGGAKIAGAILNFAAPSAPPYPRVIAR